MPLTKELEKQAKEDIYTAIYSLIDRYLDDGVTIYDIDRHFNMKKPFMTLLSDINYAGRRYFADEEDYPGFVKQIFRKCILDKKAEIETISLSEKNIKKFGDFLNEATASIENDEDITVEYLFNDIGYSEEDKDILATFFKTKAEYVESKDPEYCVYTITDFQANVLNNNRISFNALILANYQIEKMKGNLIKKIVSGVFAQIPNEIDYMGIRVKPHTLMDKSKLKEAVEKLVTDQQILDLVTKLTSYGFVSKYGDYYIWKKAN